jgi:hypothetical protein
MQHAQHGRRRRLPQAHQGHLLRCLPSRLLPPGGAGGAGEPVRAARQYSEIPEDYNLRDWKDGVLIRADADLLRKMRDDTSSKVDLLEKRVASLEREPQPLQKGLIEPVRHQLEIERMKLEEIEARIRRVG